MEDHGLQMLAASTLALAVGPLLHHMAGRRRSAMIAFHVLLVAAVFAIIVLHILPECVEVAGWGALFAAGAGLLGPILIEHKFKRASEHGGRLALLLAFSAIFIHEVSDGVAIVAGEMHAHAHHEPETMHGLGIAVILHRIPVGAALWFLLRPRGLPIALLGMVAVACSTGAGFLLGEQVLHLLDGAGIALFQAFVGGVLLHALVHRHDAPAHAHASAAGEEA
jgi:hypothetical protein